MAPLSDNSCPRPASRLEVKFSQPAGTHGWIYLSLGFQSPDGTWRRDTADISYCYCPFTALKEWMEALVRGEPCRTRDAPRNHSWHHFRVPRDAGLVEWEDEGSEVYLMHLRGRLLFKSKGHGGRWWRVRIPAREVAVAFYSAFRLFVATEYDRTRYETLRTLREVAACSLGPRNRQTSFLIALSRLQLSEAIDALYQRMGPHLGRRISEIQAPTTSIGLFQWELDEAWLRSMFKGWPAASRRSRMRMLRRLLETPQFQFGSDNQLAGVRSRLLERCLAHDRRDGSDRCGHTTANPEGRV